MATPIGGDWVRIQLHWHSTEHSAVCATPSLLSTSHIFPQVEAVDEDSGHTYYANSVSTYCAARGCLRCLCPLLLQHAVTLTPFAAGVTQWEYPQELQATETAAEAAAPTWIKGVDPDSGHPYWYVSQRRGDCQLAARRLCAASLVPMNQLFPQVQF